MAAAHRIHLVTGDESVLSTVRAACAPLEYELETHERTRELTDDPPALGDVIVLDGALAGENVYEACRTLAGRTRCRTFVLVDGQQVAVAEPIALFCGATGVLGRPLGADALRDALADTTPRPPLERELRAGARDGMDQLPERLLRELAGEPSASLIDALIDPETSLFNFEFLSYKLDEEYKRAKRFQYPLSCAMLGFEGQASDDVLGRLAAIFLSASRDTDVLGRFDESSFLFLLPNTGPDGAAVMAERIRAEAQEQGLRDLVGDALQIAVGISSFPHPSVERREDLYARVREAYYKAREVGGVV